MLMLNKWKLVYCFLQVQRQIQRCLPGNGKQEYAYNGELAYYEEGVRVSNSG